ncbi:MAG TPA: methylmalonyl-CoA carboxyltransferase [Clostridiales bacterium]|nr:methylmalonyl-CoA carboxyltransferase [Clostridiales bacterium]
MSKLELLRQKDENALAAGGKDKTDAQHKAGKKTARERIHAILDGASFVEVDKFVKRTYATPGFEAKSETGEGVVCGYGTIEDRPVFVFAQDYTVLAGSLSQAHAAKIEKVIGMAAKCGNPVIGILDSDGARIAEGVAAIDSYAGILKKLSDVSGVIPTVSIVAGNCIGSAAYIAATTDFCFMVEGIAKTALHGPQIYESTLGAKINIKTAFSAQLHNEETGVAQFLAKSEDDCYAQVKRLLGYLPSNNLEECPYVPTEDDLNRAVAAGEGYEYDAKALIAALCDGGGVMEYQAYYSPEIVTAIGRMNGGTVGFVANSAEGKVTGHAARKASRFISLMDAYNIPIVTLANCGGSSVEGERSMDIANYARLIASYAQAGVPMVCVVTGKAVGDGYAMMCPKSLGADIVYAWPEAEITALPVEAGAVILYEDAIQSGALTKAQAIEKYRDDYANPWQAAEQGVVDDVIDPKYTRQMVIAALEMCLTKREEKLAKKHNVLPL